MDTATESQPAPPAAAAAPRRILLHRGGIGNARVWRVEGPDGSEWIEKDFSENPWIVRQTLGRFLIFREAWILRRLEKTGAVPGGVRRLSPFRLREDFCPGFALRDSAAGVYRSNVFDPAKAHGVPPEMLREPIPRAFFEAFEEAVRRIHDAGFVHLDLHNARNVMVAPGFRPVLLDWQSALPTFPFLPPLRRALRGIDLTGVYKLWEKFRPGELDEARTAVLRRGRRLRRLWIPRLHRVRPDERPLPAVPKE